MISFSIDASKFDSAMKSIAENFQVSMSNVVRVEAKSLLETVVKFTPPNTYAQGRRAVARDITRAVDVPAKFTNERLNELVRGREYAAFRTMMENSKELKKYKLTLFRKSLHTSQRDRRGHVRSYKRVLTLDVEQQQQRIKTVQSRVGTAKKSWKQGLEVVGGKLPAWAEKATGSSGNATLKNQLNHPTNPEIEVTNTTPGVVNSQMLANQLARAVKIRTNAMQRILNLYASDPIKYANLLKRYQ
jgi:hypothetical protein